MSKVTVLTQLKEICDICDKNKENSHEIAPSIHPNAYVL